MIAKVWRFLRKASMMEFFSKVVCLQCSDCNSSIKRFHRRFFPQNVSKNSCLKKNILRKKSMMENVLIELRPCSTKPASLSKTELNRAHVRPVCRSAENSFNVFTKNLLGGSLFSVKISTTKTAVRYLCQAFFNKVEGIQSIATLSKIMYFSKIYRTNF